MKETILLVPGANGTELTRMLARFGKNTLGLRTMNATELARFALMRSGIILKEDFLPRKQEAAVVDGFVRSIPYFASAGYADSEKIADTLFSLRSLIPEQEEETLREKLPSGEFPEKNTSLLTLYERYICALRSAKSLDSIGLIRKALAQAKSLDCPIYTLREYPLTPLEDALANRLTGTRISSCLSALLEKPDAPLHNIDYTESYGSTNEVEAILGYILSHRIPFDQCTVATAAPGQYAQLFYDYAQRWELPMTAGCGVPILNTNPARLLKLLYDWNNSGYHGVDALGAILHSDALDRKKLLGTIGLENSYDLDKVISIAGGLRLNFDREENDRKLAALPAGTDFYPQVAALSQVLALGESKLLTQYSLIRKGSAGRVDRSALSVICNALDSYAKYTGGRPLDQIIPEILQRSVCSENSREGALFVTGISGAIASMRKHLFLAGMSASNFPGAPRENYLLLDSDYLLFAGEETAPTSATTIRRKKDSLDHLLTLASCLDVHIHISYSDYNLSTLKAENPSSALYDIFKKEQGEKATLEQYRKAFRQVGYFDQQISGDYTLGRAFVDNKEITADTLNLEEPPCAVNSKKPHSPTALDQFFNCPRRYFLTYVLGVKEEEEDDPFQVIDAATTGTLAHDLMKDFAAAPCDLNTFLQRAAKAFDDFLLTRPPVHPERAVEEKRAFCKMMQNAYEMDPKNNVVVAEKDQCYTHISGVPLSGIPDRVEQTRSGEYIIADYKTGRKVKHKENDIDTCLQVVVYAYLMEQRGFPITRCEYRYLRNKVTIHCRYDDAMKDALNQKLLAFKEALDTGQFPPASSKDACTYCKLGAICGKNTPEEVKTE